jgi:hypothetical protein
LETTYTFVVRVAEIRVPGTLAEAGYVVNPSGSTVILDKHVSRSSPTKSNWTADSLPASTTTGLESNPPAPIAWEVQPYINAQTSVSMTAAAAQDEHPPVSYIFLRYTNATDQIAEKAVGPMQNRTWVDTDVQVGETWTYTFVAVDNLGNTSNPAPRVTVQITPFDPNPPTPNPPTWAIQPIRQFVNNKWWDFMEVAVETDPEGTLVQYQVRDTVTGDTSLWQLDAPQYAGPDGNLYDGRAFWVEAGGQFSERSYECRARDSSVNQNTTAWSTPSLPPLMSGN